MSSASWRKNTTVIEKLTEHPYRFSFKQAVRLLERSNFYNDSVEQSSTHPVGHFMPPQSESIRFASKQALSFPSAELSAITALKKEDTTNNQWKMEVNFIGLTGCSGVLPYHYTETLLKRLKFKDPTIKEFYNLFNHRITSLFHRASTKYNVPLEYERARLASNGNRAIKDNYTKMLLSLIGFGTNYLGDRLHIKDESLLQYAGLLNSNVKSSSGLIQILESHFQLPVKIKEFVGQWQPLIDDVRTRFPARGMKGQNNQLGKTVMLGKQGYFAQGKINIILGPLSREQLQKFNPKSTQLKALDELVRLYLGFEQDYRFILQAKRKHLPESASFKKGNRPILGWTTCLNSQQGFQGSGDEIINIPVAVKQ